MRLWSKGLGKLILPFYLDKAESVSPFPDYVLIRGRIVEGKVNWPYKIFLFPQDMVRFIKFMAQNDVVISFLKRNLGFSLVKFLILGILKTFLIITPKVLFMKIFSRKKSEIVYDEIIAKIIEEKNKSGKEKSSEENKSGDSSQKEIDILPDDEGKDGENSREKLNLVKSKANQDIYQGGMIFWSKGLGRRSHIVIPCGEEKPEDKGDVIVLHGKTLPPVVWIYTMTMEPQDFVSILRLGLSYEFIDFLLHPKKVKFAFPLLFYLIHFAGKYTIMRRKFYQIYRREDVQKENNEAVQVQH
jgi:hypothetical protein